MHRSEHHLTTPHGARRVAGLLLALTLLAGTASPGLGQARPPQPPDLTTLDLEQLMQLEVVFAASKRNQNPREVASVVSVVTAAQIAQHGYRTLADVLRSLPSFYVSYDRNYSYVGVRGFARPGDYSSRVLLLLNGLRTNDNIYDQASIGEEFVVDVDLIDRVEVVRGPSAAIYGSSAFFAVINVVTKRGADVHGAELSGSGGSFESYTGRATYGTKLGNGIEALTSASIVNRAGPAELYYAEFDDPSSGGGMARDADGESAHKLFASLSRGNLSFEASHSSRNKIIPTGAYETIFGDPRTRTLDQMSLARLTYDRSLEQGSVSARLHAGRSRYHGEYVYEVAAPNQDLGIGEWWGADLDLTRPLWKRNLITAGVEYRNNHRQDQRNYDRAPYASYIDERHESQRVGIFAQNELKLFAPLVLYAGVRHDWYDTFGSMTTPRLGAIYNPDAATTLKLMGGRAFRAPNEYELHYAGGLGYKANPSLGPERIETLELAVERRIGGGMRLIASGFRNQITELISLQRDPADDLVVFQNLGRIRSQGVELGLDVNRGRGPTGHVGYAYQKTTDRDTGVELTNSPNHMAKVGILVPFGGWTTGLETQYVSDRQTLGGAEARGYTVSNLSLNLPRVIGRLETSATIYNLFGTTYGFPGSEEHVQDIIQQDGRTFRIKATLRF
jgi:iron complex outermembrane receptor protein